MFSIQLIYVLYYNTYCRFYVSERVAGTRPTVNGGHLPRLATPQTAAAAFNVVF